MLALLILVTHLGLAQAQPLKPGDTVPNWTLPRTGTTEKYHLYDFDGQIVILDFFHWWCPACRLGSSILDRYLTDHYAARGGTNRWGVPVTVLSVNRDGGSAWDTPNALRFVEALGGGLVVDDHRDALLKQFIPASELARGTTLHFAIINGVSHAAGRKPWELLLAQTWIWEDPSLRNLIDSIRPTVVIQPPTITQQPRSMDVTVGGSGSLRVSVSGTPPFTYRWYRDGLEVPEAASEVLAFPIMRTDDAGVYRVRVSNSSGSVDSAEARVRVLPAQTLELKLGAGPKLTVKGPAGTRTRLEWAADLSGPWLPWTNLVATEEGTQLTDPSPGTNRRFYRAVADLRPVGPPGYVWIPPGTFVRGSPPAEPGRWDDEVQHTVTLTQGFWLSDHEVTQAEYQTVVGVNPSYFKGDINLPVESVAWHEAVLYCQKLTERERAAGRISTHMAYRLPTEAEWEYAARAGTTGARHGDLSAIAWHSGNSGNQTRPVKQKAPNAWGLHDMIGNVWEWCSDWYGPYPTGSVSDPAGPRSGSYRVDRGGSWYDEASYCRSAYRERSDPGVRSSLHGFRPALSAVR